MKYIKKRHNYPFFPDDLYNFCFYSFIYYNSNYYKDINLHYYVIIALNIRRI